MSDTVGYILTGAVAESGTLQSAYIAPRDLNNALASRSFSPASPPTSFPPAAPSRDVEHEGFSLFPATICAMDSQSSGQYLPFSISHFCGGDPTLPSASRATAIIHSTLASGSVWGIPPWYPTDNPTMNSSSQDALLASSSTSQVHLPQSSSSTPSSLPGRKWQGLSADDHSLGKLSDKYLVEFSHPEASMPFLTVMHMPTPLPTAILAPPSVPKFCTKHARKTSAVRTWIGRFQSNYADGDEIECTNFGTAT